jgi:NAD(P)-dependent dehydrogenase (short-subunit alcohol dehydrogenase family)
MVRRLLFDWRVANERSLAGQVAVVSGATSGLGRECATELARLGASVIMLVRDPVLGSQVRTQIEASTNNSGVSVVVCDVGDLESVRHAANELKRLPAINILVHNAGAMTRTRQLTSQGIEVTTAVHLIGPFLLTQLMLEQLQAGRARVIWVASGGMYAEELDVDWLRSSSRDYDGVRAYARVKRAQVSLVATWAPRLAGLGITMTAMHPGWVDTPGVRASLPMFRRLMAPLLRNVAQGVDTIIWSLTAPVEMTPPGTLWLDRRARDPHRLRRTRQSDTAAQRERLWQFCLEQSGLETSGKSAS